MVKSFRPVRLLLVLAIMVGGTIAASHGRVDLLAGSGFLLWALTYTNPRF